MVRLTYGCLFTVLLALVQFDRQSDSPSKTQAVGQTHSRTNAAFSIAPKSSNADQVDRSDKQSLAVACRCTKCASLLKVPSQQRAYWQTASSANFTVCCPSTNCATPVLQRCETVRATLIRQWLPDQKQDWGSKCYVVIHPQAASYIQAVGRAAGETSGCTTVKELNGKILSRRIDLRADRPNPLNRTLPHEMTHAVLAEVTAAHKLPRWADEGMALLADTQEKQLGHHADLQRALANRSQMRVPTLLVSQEYPAVDQMQLFYGQSSSLTRMLIEQGSHAQFLQFAQDASQHGYDQALRKHYQIQGVLELERRWLKVAGQQQVATVSQSPPSSGAISLVSTE